MLFTIGHVLQLSLLCFSRRRGAVRTIDFGDHQGLAAEVSTPPDDRSTLRMDVDSGPGLRCPEAVDPELGPRCPKADANM